MNLPIALPFRPETATQNLLTAQFASTLQSCVNNRWVLLSLKAIIGFVSAYDIFLTIKYVEVLPMMELNPIGLWLMNFNGGTEGHLSQIALFVAAKFSGNFIALAVIELLAAWRSRAAFTVAFVVALFQLGLLYFLLFGELAQR